jgi:hypothetical protein
MAPKARWGLKSLTVAAIAAFPAFQAVMKLVSAAVLVVVAAAAAVAAALASFVIQVVTQIEIDLWPACRPQVSLLESARSEKTARYHV